MSRRGQDGGRLMVKKTGGESDEKRDNGGEAPASACSVCLEREECNDLFLLQKFLILPSTSTSSQTSPSRPTDPSSRSPIYGKQPAVIWWW